MRERGLSRGSIHVRLSGNSNGARAEMLTASASPGNGQAFYPYRTNGN
jgi:hypothetical protein